MHCVSQSGTRLWACDMFNDATSGVESKTNVEGNLVVMIYGIGNKNITCVITLYSMCTR